MGIKVEYNPDLALRNIEEYKKGNRKKEECIPENLEENKIYEFLKTEQRNYWLDGEIPLIETDGKQLSKPKASIIILEATHYKEKDKTYTKGKYLVKEVFRTDEIRFNGFEKIN